jgi:hypothetical protein
MTTISPNATRDDRDTTELTAATREEASELYEKAARQHRGEFFREIA